ncbi:methyltransferase domain-containing protein [Sulfurovum sp. zt1-1]|uniref:Methyltransferase domain-containing protein n=1 Tax=Sulfurovum zhangzhouensis TaxID=3019067 RepID=A0ABT7R0L1_9BACT|nr:methyltransferase domain-containing protein [Sulfurovum zhangzhouensis]MDM5272628.1 methyltransferase domain-containing protein [Sulfurovum zhangzhouensis]
MPNKVKKQPSAVKGFSRFAHTYEQYNMIQAEVAKQLVSGLEKKHYSTIIDIGCGSGAVIKNLEKRSIGFDKFIAVDLSEEMLSLHPSEENIMKCCVDFNRQESFDKLSHDKEAIVISSSALQWSKDLDLTFSCLSKIGKKAYFAVFTSGTFKTLHKNAGITSPIYQEEVVKKVISKYYNANFILQSYQLTFPNVKEMFRYIQKSGVSGGERQLGYKKMKRLMEEYPLDYLEFEVLFVDATPL